MLNRLFVYGTLKRGFGNNRLLEDSEYIKDATLAEAVMVSLVNFPGVIKGQGEVKGEIWEVRQEDWPRLDRLEGHPNFYKREIVETSEGQAWCYYLNARNAENRPRVTSGVWKK